MWKTYKTVADAWKTILNSTQKPHDCRSGFLLLLLCGVQVDADFSPSGNFLILDIPIGENQVNFPGLADTVQHDDLKFARLGENDLRMTDLQHFAQYRAFVSMADGATVQNLTLSDAYICGTQFVAAFCANAQNGTVIRNCRVYDSYLAGTYSCAGICARAVGSTVRDCINASSVSVSVEGAGGILGQSGDHHVTVENCLNSGSVYAKAGIAGGIVGRTEYNVTIRNCLSVGALSGSELVGNILGKYYYTKFSVLNCAFKRGEHSALGGGSSPYEFTLSAGSYTEEELASGKVAYKLNADENDIHWYQTLGEDAYPLPDSSHKTVYPYGDDYTNTYCAHTTKKTVHVEASCSTEGYDAVVCEECGLVFEKTNIVPALGTHSYESGVFSVCGVG